MRFSLSLALFVLASAANATEAETAFLFDALHVDGEDLLDVPLRDRQARLRAIAPELTIPGASGSIQRRSGSSLSFG